MSAQTPLASAQPTRPQDRAITIAIKTPGVELPTALEDIRLSTTIGDLKRTIKERSSTHPSEARQRLIFHGRPLLRDDATLFDALGEQMIRDMDTVTIHMAIRDPIDSHSRPTIRSSAALPHGSSSSPTPLRSGDPTQAQAHHNGHQPRTARPQVPGGGNPFASLNVTQAMTQQQRQFMAQWATNLHREGLNRQVLASQNQQMYRPGMNANGQPITAGQPSVLPTGYTQAPAGPAGPAPPAGYNPMGASAENARGRSSPTPGLQPGMTRTIVREGVSPDGMRWRIVNQQPTAQRPAGNAGLSAHEVQNILRQADASHHASQAIANSMQRSASNASHQSGRQLPVGVTTPLMSASRPLSRTATPDPTRTSSHGSNIPTPGISTMGQAPAPPQVYLVQSPEGPRALLFNHLGEWFTPLVHPQAANPNPLIHPYFPQNIGTAQPTGIPQQTQFPPMPTVANTQGLRQRNVQQRNGDGHVGVRREVVQRPRNVRPIHPPNPGAAAVLAQAWPHVWLLLRLGLFVWWFTGPETSWARWLTIFFMAMTIFVLNTGVLNGVADLAWGPVRRHFENMIPLQAPRPGQAPRQDGAGPAAAAANQNNAAAGGEPNPADLAARLLEQAREGNANWLTAHIRRIERASLLFLASLAPGIAERHIRHLEEEEQRRERERREAAEAAEAQAQAAQTRAQEQAEAGANNNQGGEGQNATDTHDVGGQEGQAQQGQGDGNDANNMDRPDLLLQAA